MKATIGKYGVIRELAKKAYKSNDVVVQCLIFGDTYEVSLNGELKLKGTAANVETELVKMINGGN